MNSEPLDVLEEWAYDKFNLVKNNELKRPSYYPERPFTQDNLGKKYRIVPIKAMNPFII
jgi:secreted Zn-dependent insulinase-like peptidase